MPQEAQLIASQTCQKLPWDVSSVCTKIGAQVMATKRQNHPRPRPSAPVSYTHLTLPTILLV